MFLIPDNETATAEGKDQSQLRLQLQQRSTESLDQTSFSVRLNYSVENKNTLNWEKLVLHNFNILGITNQKDN